MKRETKQTIIEYLMGVMAVVGLGSVIYELIKDGTIEHAIPFIAIVLGMVVCYFIVKRQVDDFW